MASPVGGVRLRDPGQRSNLLSGSSSPNGTTSDSPSLTRPDGYGGVDQLVVAGEMPSPDSTAYLISPDEDTTTTTTDAANAVRYRF